MKSPLLIILPILFISGCTAHRAAVEDDVQASPAVNCASARNDLKILEDEKVGLVGRVASGVTMITPVGLVAGILTGTMDTKLRVAVGDYNTMLDKHIAKIKATCGL